jgi:TolA-binding protein
MTEGSDEGWKNFFRNGFWKLNVGHLALVAAVLVGYGRSAERFATFGRQQIKDELRQDRMDREGTNASKSAIQLQGQLIADHEKRITKTEDAISNIAVMKGKIDRMSDDIHELNTRRK